MCSKRRELKVDDRIVLARQVASSGKQTVLSTLALIRPRRSSGRSSDWWTTALLIEANDPAQSSSPVKPACCLRLRPGHQRLQR